MVYKKIGIDTSKHQRSKVDYKKFKDSGGDFVFLRIGCNKTKDSCFEKDYAAAMAAGLRVGVYFYTYSTNDSGAAQDASRVLGWLNDRKLHLPVVYDIEDPVQQGSFRRIENSSMYNTFADKIMAAGYKSLLYTGEYFFKAYFQSSMIYEKPWIAKYSTSKPNIGKDISIWQHSSSKIDTPYYKGALDRNYMVSDEWSGDLVEVPVASNPYPVPTRTLKKTIPLMKGNDVRWLQYELKKHGLIESGGVDGSFGNKTLAAVRVYQQQNGLLVDGKAGPATRYSLLHSGKVG